MRISDWSSDVCSSDLDDGSSGLPLRRRKAMRVLLFFIYFFGFAIAVPGIAVAVVQARYGLIDGPPSYPLDPFGEQLKSFVKYGVFVWAGMQFFLFGRVDRKGVV